LSTAAYRSGRCRGDPRRGHSRPPSGSRRSSCSGSRSSITKRHGASG